MAESSLPNTETARKVTVNCMECGKPLIRMAADVLHRRETGVPIFCSSKCRWIIFRKNRTTEDVARKAFDRHQRNARARGIPFSFTFEEWWRWWQTDDRWSNRGRGAGQFVMARYGDTGPYAVDNVFCSDAVENSHARAADPSVTAKQVSTMRASSNYQHLRDRMNHPCRKPVISPTGTFPSAALAAAAHGIHVSYAAKLAKSGTKGWRYA